MYVKLLSFFKKILFGFKQASIQKPNAYDSKTTQIYADLSLPDTTTMEQTMFMFQRIRTVFDFAPPIPLITEMRIINRGLSPSYHGASTQDKNAIASEISSTIHKFSHILPELDFLLSKIENISTQKIMAGETETIKKEIICALEKVSDKQNTVINLDYLPEKKNHYLTFDNRNTDNDNNS